MASAALRAVAAKGETKASNSTCGTASPILHMPMRSVNGSVASV
jgi:hypothetical protein